MKNIFRIFAAAVAGVVLFASCLNEAAPLASSVSVDKTEVNPVGVGSVPVTVKVTADGDWFAVSSSEWISVEPANGGQGVTEVTLKFADNVDSYNELNGPRSGSVSFCYGTAGVAAVTVNQKGENGLDASRTYTLVSKAEDFQEGSYLVVFDVDKKKQALKASTTMTETYYEYLLTTPVSDPVENVITMPNGFSSFTFESVEGGYTIKQSDGRYLFQSGSYASFYATSDASKADVWAVAFDEEGRVEIKNTTKANQIMHFSSYGNVEATTKEVKAEEKPTLYYDSKPATDEVLEVPEEVMAFNTATSATIDVVSNKTWKVRNHDSWIKTFTTSGEGNGTIEITFDPIAADAEPRTAEFLVIGETANFTVTLTQKVPDCIADLYPQIQKTNDTFLVNLKEPAVVTYVNDGNAFIEDATGGILYYKNGHGLSVGQKISGLVEGTGDVYKDLTEIISITSTPTIENGDAPEYPVVSLSEVLDNYDRYMSCFVKLEGVKVEDTFSNSDKNGKISQGGKNIALYVKSGSGFNFTKDSEGTIIGAISINSGTKQITFWDADHFTATKIASEIAMLATLNAYVEDVKDLGATTNSTETITYVSSDPTVATVSADGKVTALKVGETTITASVAAAGICTAAEATCVVTVSEKSAGEQANDGSSAATAFTVAEAKAYYEAGNSTSTKVWVKGVIIGSMVDNKFVEGTADASASNMVIGTAESYLPVQLSSGSSVRTVLNLKDNPTNISKEVALYGTIEKYFSVAGVKNVTAYEFL